MQGKVRFRLQQLFKIPRKLRLKKRFRIDAYEKLSVSKTGKNVRCQVVRLKAKSWCQASSCPGQAWRLRCHKNISSTTMQRKIVQPLGTSCSHSENHNSRRLKEILYIQVVFPHSIIDKIGFLQDLRVSRYTRRQRNSNGALYTRTKRPINQRIVRGHNLANSTVSAHFAAHVKCCGSTPGIYIIVNVPKYPGRHAEDLREVANHSEWMKQWAFYTITERKNSTRTSG